MLGRALGDSHCQCRRENIAQFLRVRFSRHRRIFSRHRRNFSRHRRSFSRHRQQRGDERTDLLKEFRDRRRPLSAQRQRVGGDLVHQPRRTSACIHVQDGRSDGMHACNRVRDGRSGGMYACNRVRDGRSDGVCACNRVRDGRNRVRGCPSDGVAVVGCEKVALSACRSRRRWRLLCTQFKGDRVRLAKPKAIFPPCIGETSGD